MEPKEESDLHDSLMAKDVRLQQAFIRVLRNGESRLVFYFDAASSLHVEAWLRNKYLGGFVEDHSFPNSVQHVFIKDL